MRLPAAAAFLLSIGISLAQEPPAAPAGAPGSPAPVVVGLLTTPEEVARARVWMRTDPVYARYVGILRERAGCGLAPPERLSPGDAQDGPVGMSLRALHLGETYALTGDRADARAAAEILRLFVRNASEEGFSPSTELARCVFHLLVAYDLTGRDEAYAQEDRVSLCEYFHEASMELTALPPRGRGAVWLAATWAAAGTLLGDPSLVPRALGGTREFDLPAALRWAAADSARGEFSALRGACALAGVARCCGVALETDADCAGPLHDVFAAPIACVRPDGTLCSGKRLTEAAPIYEWARLRFADPVFSQIVRRAAGDSPRCPLFFTWYAPDLPGEGEMAPEERSVLLDEVPGQALAVLRSRVGGGQGAPRCAVMDCSRGVRGAVGFQAAGTDWLRTPGEPGRDDPTGRVEQFGDLAGLDVISASWDSTVEGRRSRRALFLAGEYAIDLWDDPAPWRIDYLQMAPPEAAPPEPACVGLCGRFSPLGRAPEIPDPLRRGAAASWLGLAGGEWTLFLGSGGGRGMQMRFRTPEGTWVQGEVSSGWLSPGSGQAALRVSGAPPGGAVLLEAFGGAPRARRFDPGSDAGTYVVDLEGGIRDEILADLPGGRYGIVRVRDGGPCRFSAVGVRRLEGAGRPLMTAEWPLDAIEVRYEGELLEVDLSPGYGQVLVWSPAARTVRVNGTDAPPRRMGEWCQIVELVEGVAWHWETEALVRGGRTRCVARLWNPGPAAWEGRLEADPDGSVEGVPRVRSGTFTLGAGEGGEVSVEIDLPQEVVADRIKFQVRAGGPVRAVEMRVDDRR